ncbi:MAG: EF-hand domain-containing protein [Gammaproteobacteria bacterium]|nr:EF-hand domain-containing protein [Gammaproteobacteria bacterium]
MSVQFHRILSICLKLACVAVVICSVSISGSSDEPNTTDLEETLTKPSLDLALEDWQSEMSRVSETMSKIFANIEKAFEQTQAHLTKVQEAAENFQNVAMRNVATQINSTVKDLSESIPKWSSKWTSRMDRLDTDGDGALTWDEVSPDSQVDSTDSDEKTFVVGSKSGKSSLESEFDYIDRNEDGKVDRAEIEQIVDELESVRQSMQDMVKNQLAPESDENQDHSVR